MTQNEIDALIAERDALRAVSAEIQELRASCANVMAGIEGVIVNGLRTELGKLQIVPSGKVSRMSVDQDGKTVLVVLDMDDGSTVIFNASAGGRIHLKEVA